MGALHSYNMHQRTNSNKAGQKRFNLMGGFIRLSHHGIVVGGYCFRSQVEYAGGGVGM